MHHLWSQKAEMGGTTMSLNRQCGDCQEAAGMENNNGKVKCQGDGSLDNFLFIVYSVPEVIH